MAATTTKAEEVFAEQFSKKSADALSFLGELNEANQKVLTGVVEFSSSTAKEALRLYSDLQVPVLAALKNAHELLANRHVEVQNAQKDPMGWSQKAVQETLDAAQANLKLLENSARTITQSAERLQASGEQTSKEIQQTLASLGNRLKTLFTSPA